MAVTLTRDNTNLRFEFSVKIEGAELLGSKDIPLIECLTKEQAATAIRGAASLMIDTALRPLRKQLVDDLATRMMGETERQVLDTPRGATEATTGGVVVSDAIRVADSYPLGSPGPLSAPTLLGEENCDECGGVPCLRRPRHGSAGCF